MFINQCGGRVNRAKQRKGMAMNNYRHGDMALIGINELPAGLNKSASKVLMTGSGGNHHTYDKGEFYPVDGGGRFVIGCFVAADATKLYHPEHGEKVKGKKLREAKIAAGVYEIRKQQEDTHEGMKPVID